MISGLLLLLFSGVVITTWPYRETERLQAFGLTMKDYMVFMSIILVLDAICFTWFVNTLRMIVSGR